jgi:cobalt/nickel transport system permease protein
VHLADGIVTDVRLVAAASLVSVGALGIALGRVTRDRTAQTAWTGSLAAFVFAAQAVNVPLVPGASAHAIGASLLALTLGPARAIVALCAVVLAQALILADGGVVMLGVNMLNIAIIPVLTVFAVQRALGRDRLTATAVLGTTFGNLFGALSLTALLVRGADAPPTLTVSWLLGVQCLAGLIEGGLTAAALRHLVARRPELAALPAVSPTTPPGVSVNAGWFAIVFGILLAMVPLSSSVPDALERVVADLPASAQ